MKYLLLIGSLRIIFVISVSYPGDSYCCACTHRDFSALVHPAPPQTPGEISCSCDGYWYIWIIWLFTFYEKYWSIVTLQCWVSFCCYSQWVILFSGKLLIEEPQAVEGMLLFSLWVMSDSLQPRGLKHARLLRPSLFPGVGSHSCMSIESLMLCKCLTLCRPRLLLPSVFPSIGVFSNELALCNRREKYWTLNISTSSEYSGLISFRSDWFDLLTIQGFLKSTAVQKHKFFGTQLSLWSTSHIHTWLLEKP